MAKESMTARQAEFVRQYLVDLNATQAAIRTGYSAKTANEQGARLLANVSVAEAVSKAKEDRASRTQVTADKVLERFWSIATADPNELIEYRRTCCRSCYGEGNRYQRTQAEMDRDWAAWDKAVREEQAKPDGRPIPPFDEQGGVGYDARRLPNSDCEVCFGDGEERAFAKDTRYLSPDARRLYAGVKVTKDGLEVKMHDQASALVNVAKHLGMFTDKLEISGPGGGPMVTEILVEHHTAAPEHPPAGGSDPGQTSPPIPSGPDAGVA